jgi:hypothetical protein
MAVLHYGDDSTHYGDTTRHYGSRPMENVRKEHVALTVGGTSINASAKSHRIRSYADSLKDRYEFQFRSAGLSSIDEHDEVILVGSDGGPHKFGGFVDSFESHQSGPDFIYTVQCASFAKLLQDSNKRITRVYESGTADSTILGDLEEYVPELDFSTYVETIEASLEREYFENLSPLQIIKHICDRTGGRWRVDFGPAGDKKAHFRYWSDGNEDPAPWELASVEDITTIDYITYFPAHNFKHTRLHGKCTTVVVEGSPDYTATPTEGQYCCEREGDGSKTRFMLPYPLLPLEDEVLVQVWKWNGTAFIWQKVGYGDRQSLADFDVVWRRDYRYLEFATAPAAPNTTLNPNSVYPFKYSAVEVRPVEGEASDQASIRKYGREIVMRVKDESVHDSATAALMAAEYLERYKASLDSYGCFTNEHGLQVGQAVPMTYTDRSMAAEPLTIKSIDAQIIGDAKWKYSLVLNSSIGTVLDKVEELVREKVDKKELEEETPRRVLGQIMFHLPGELSASNYIFPIYICQVNGLQLLSAKSHAETAPVGGDIEFKGYRKFMDPEHDLYGTGWWFIWSAGNEPYIPDGQEDGVDGTLSTDAGEPWLQEGDMIKIVVDGYGSSTPGSDVTVSLKVRQ